MFRQTTDNAEDRLIRPWSFRTASVARVLRRMICMFFNPARLSYLRQIFSGRPAALVACVSVLSLVGFVSSGWLAWFSYDITAGLPDRDAVRGIGNMAQSTTIYDAARLPAFTIFKEQRIEVPLDKVSRNLIAAVISVEDQRFFDHTGVDAIRVAAALLRNVQAGRRAQGGSTITQQLARQSFLSRDKTYRRKLKEVILATYIESLHSKQEILEMYLNKVYFGDGFYGVEAASRGYLGKSAADLNIAEAALLAGLIQSPSSYAPTVNLDGAIARRNVVLQTMVSSGAVDRATADRAKKAPVELSNSLEIKETFGLYFKEQVRRELVDRFGWERVYQGGLRVYTSMNTDMQRSAERLLEENLKDIENRRGFKYPARGKHALPSEGAAPDYLQGALFAMDPTTGHVLAMVGGRDFGESRFNRAVQAKRQSGSAFKPFVYAAALEAGYSPATMITGLNDPIATLQGDWLPEDEHSTADAMTLRAGLRTSSNRAAVQLLESVGIPETVGYAEKLNVGTPPSVPSLALGASDVTLSALTAAYGAFANGGIVRTPVLVVRVEDNDGTVLFKNDGESHRAVSEATAFLMASMLSDVINAGTAYRARQAGFRLPAGGKTGTTNDYFDAWFVGFTPRVVTGVWVGFDQPKSIITSGYGGEVAVPIWTSFMKVATRGAKPEWIARPSNVIAVNVCRLSGHLPNQGCGDVHVALEDGRVEQRSMIYTEYFVRGTQPNEVCALHPAPSFMQRLAGAFGRDPDVITAGEVGVPLPPATSTTGAKPPATAKADQRPRDSANDKAEKAEEEPKKKRGFWGRLFGRGDDQDADKKKEDEKKKEEERKKEEAQKRSQRKPGG
jgi:penicillin-binding protein 1A